MEINGIILNASLMDILVELRSQLVLNDVHYFRVLKESGDDIMTCCPAHSNGVERKPSMGIRMSDGVCHCFSCGYTSSLQKLISYCFGYEDDMIGAFGWKWLLKNFATVEVEERKDVELDLERNQNSRKHRGVGFCGVSSGIDNFNTDSNIQVYVSEEELNRYRYIHPYMYKRKLTDEIIELFDIGYDKNTRCITFPVRDIKGNCLFVARRSVNTKFFNYPQGVEKPLYGIYEINKKRLECEEHRMPYNYFPNEIIVCESMLDALTCWVYGKYAVALNGLGNDTQFKQLRELPCRKLILATDADERGMVARKRIRKNIHNTKIVTEYLWNLEDAKDINDMTKEQFLSLKEVL